MEPDMSHNGCLYLFTPRIPAQDTSLATTKTIAHLSEFLRSPPNLATENLAQQGTQLVLTGVLVDEAVLHFTV
jgi:hypothetical protein